MSSNDQTTTPSTTKTRMRRAATAQPRRMVRELKAPASNEAIPAASEPGAAPNAPTATTPSSDHPPSKQAIVLELLQRAEGASLDELIAATGWLPHSTRAALTGLRKKGHAIERSKTDDRTVYRIAGGQG